MRLYPRSIEDTISFDIFHAKLGVPDSCIPPKRLSIPDLRQTLPKGWTVQETLDGRYLFTEPTRDGECNSWLHPDFTIHPSLYEALDPEDVSEYKPKFEALSYTWGSTAHQEVAIIGDPSIPKVHQTTMKIGTNLAVALRHLRYPHEFRILWVDAVCIWECYPY